MLERGWGCRISIVGGTRAGIKYHALLLLNTDLVLVQGGQAGYEVPGEGKTQIVVDRVAHGW